MEGFQENSSLFSWHRNSWSSSLLFSKLLYCWFQLTSIRLLTWMIESQPRVTASLLDEILFHGLLRNIKLFLEVVRRQSIRVLSLLLLTLFGSLLRYKSFTFSLLHHEFTQTICAPLVFGYNVTLFLTTFIYIENIYTLNYFSY